MKRSVLFVLAAMALVGLVFAASGCGPISDLLPGDESGSSGERGDAGGGPSLDAFLDADSKTGDYSSTTTWFEGDSVEQSGEFWVDGRLFRYDIYEDGELVRSVMSPDGETAYFVYYAEEACEPSVASVDHYLLEYSRPEGEGVEDGVDEETGASRVVYKIQQTDNLEGSANAWYSEDVTYLVKDDVVIGIISRGAVPEDDGTISGLDVSRDMWSNVKAGIPIPADTFELPFPVRTAE
ncbi:MAG TPA: hypothetical protein VLA05_06550 [Coriobacteriia bacterium]|nr:hypothetical protein [Coriobacteriia bacterium]